VRRRDALIRLAALAAAGVASVAGWPATAAGFVRRSFTPEPLERTLAALGASGATPSPAISLLLPDVAEDGAAVQMSLTTTLAAVRALVLVRRNRIPLVADIEFPPGTVPFFEARIKMAEDSEVMALIETEDGRWYSAAKQVKVILGGCGGQD